MTTAGRSPARTVAVFRATVLATVLTATAVTLLVTAVPASAHDVLDSTNPANEAVVDRLPDRVVLTFDEPALAIGTQVVVTGPAGPVSDGPPQLVDAEVRQPVRAGPAGRYTVLWRVTSADGHPVSGTFAFTTQQASTASPTATTGTTTSLTTSPTSAPTSAPTSPPTAVPATTPATTSQTGGLPGVAIAAVVVGVLALLTLGWWAFRRRRAQQP